MGTYYLSSFSSTIKAALSILTLTFAASPTVAQHTPQPVEANGGVAYVAPKHLPPPPLSERPIVKVDFSNPKNGMVLSLQKVTPGHQLLRVLFTQGVAAGNVGDLYDNRDRGHSKLDLTAHPQLTEILYHPVLRDQNIDLGLSLGLLFDAPLIGNSSTALTVGPLARSLPRVVLTGMAPNGIEALFENYQNNQIHVYPSYKDYEPGGKDMIPANTPYYIMSQGASGYDRAQLEALAMILAAFRPDTKARLKETGLLAPTVQMVYRRSRDQVPDRAAYLSAAAHPTAFPTEGLNLSRMVALANTIMPNSIPPLVRLKVTEEPEALPGLDMFGEGLSERLFDTPSAIARIWRSPAYQWEMVLTAEDTVDPNGRPLTFDWALVRGDPNRVKIEPLDETGTSARVTIAWQTPRIVEGSQNISSARVDIAIFANNGAHDSAPGFLSVQIPDHETRDYELGPNRIMRIAKLVRSPTDGVPFDPIIFPRTDWVDEYSYEGVSLTGWKRVSNQGETLFNAMGDVDGRTPLYPIISDSAGRRYVTQEIP